MIAPISSVPGRPPHSAPTTVIASTPAASAPNGLFDEAGAVKGVATGDLCVGRQQDQRLDQ